VKDKLTYSNDWESDIYHVDGRRVKTLKEVQIFGRPGEIAQFYPVKPKQVGVTCYDMGHQYSAVSTHYFITVRVPGVDVEIDLNQIVPKTKVIATKFTVEEPS